MLGGAYGLLLAPLGSAIASLPRTLRVLEEGDRPLIDAEMLLLRVH
jgi:hypothetical protein